jgi:hypothetical protein
MNRSDAAGMDRIRTYLKCEVVRWVADDPQPA